MLVCSSNVGSAREVSKAAHLQPRLELDKGLWERLLLGVEQLHSQRVRAVQPYKAERRPPQRPAWLVTQTASYSCFAARGAAACRQSAPQPLTHWRPVWQEPRARDGCCELVVCCEQASGHLRTSRRLQCACQCSAASGKQGRPCLEDVSVRVLRVVRHLELQPGVEAPSGGQHPGRQLRSLALWVTTSSSAQAAGVCSRGPVL